MIDLWDRLWVLRLAGKTSMDLLEQAVSMKPYYARELPMRHLKEEHLYPRPQMYRDSYLSLNGMWDFAPRQTQKMPKHYNEQIRVPFPPEAELRGKPAINCGSQFWYRKNFQLPKGFQKDLVLLHFGAVDQVCKVYVNGTLVGQHEGGYLPFTFDITEELQEGINELLVYVRDDLDTRYPYGKQSKEPSGMWYTKVSGIWQTVWLESVPKSYIKQVTCRPLENTVEITVDGMAKDYELTIYTPALYDQEKHPKREVYQTLTIHQGTNMIAIDQPKHWSPKHPYLYWFELQTETDKVESYFAMRTISIEENNGIKRLCLNHKPYFFHGVLDQGYFSEGIMTPVSDRYYELDIRTMKELGFNTLRKHIKIEPARFYYDCDRIGMIVFQDMVNNGTYNSFRDTISPTFYLQRKSDLKNPVPMATKEFFIRHSLDTIRYLKGFPCILYYTVFNEGWGQFESDRVTELLRAEDPDRIYDGASGWFKQKYSDVDSDHFYFHKIKPNHWTKPVIISECGGFIGISKNHSVCIESSFGYGRCGTREELTDRILELYFEEVIPNIPKGICGVIYTQLSDVEEELNGLLTYDRAVVKVQKRRMRALAATLEKELKKSTI